MSVFKGHKYTFLKPDKKLSEKKWEQKYTLLTLYPCLANAYRLKEMFNEFWGMKDKEEAFAFLGYWCDLVEESGIEPFRQAARTIIGSLERHC